MCLASTRARAHSFTTRPSRLSLVPPCLPPGWRLRLSLFHFMPRAWLFLQLTRANRNHLLNDPQLQKTFPLKPTPIHEGERGPSDCETCYTLFGRFGSERLREYYFQGWEDLKRSLLLCRHHISMGSANSRGSNPQAESWAPSACRALVLLPPAGRSLEVHCDSPSPPDRAAGKRGKWRAISSLRYK